MKTPTPPKLIVFHPSLYKPTPSTHRFNFYLLAIFSLFTFTLLLTLLKPTSPPLLPPSPTSPHPFPSTISAALLHYAISAADNSTVTTTSPRMTPRELTAISTTLLHCRRPCNLLIFGITHETLLWKALNSNPNSRTVFIDENEYRISNYERNFTDFEGYDVQYTTKVSKSEEMIRYARVHRNGECRPVQNLLFSDCKLAINDLPNHLYEIDWDVIIIDGPSGYSSKSPGRMAAIFTAAVMGRTRIQTRDRGETHVFVHEYEREVERVYSEEFLCNENLVEVTDNLGHFVIKEEKSQDHVDRFQFCTGEKLSSL